MYRAILILLLLANVMLFPSVAQADLSAVSNDVNMGKVLIVYLSRTENTKAVAEIIQQHTGGKLIGLELTQPYPTDYKAVVEQVRRENETGFLPELKTQILDLQDYDSIFIGFPTWGMRLPPPMKSFLFNNNLSGKVVFPFNTNGGYGFGSSFEQITQLCVGCNVKQGISFVGGSERDGRLLEIQGDRLKEVDTEVINWLESLAGK
jgi:flavodoxin